VCFVGLKINYRALVAGKMSNRVFDIHTQMKAKSSLFNYREDFVFK